MAMDSESVYRRVGRLIEVAPPAPSSQTLSPGLMKWLGQVSAVISETGDVTLKAEANSSIAMLQSPNRAAHFQTILITLYKALALAELKAPQSAQGAFIPVGNAFDAFAALARILGSAKSDVFIVDPYMDDTVITDFAASVSEGLPLRLLTDEATAKPNLGPAATKWNTQYPTRQVAVRIALPRTLHDRAIFLDGTQAWTVTQSLKDLAKRSPAEIVRGDDTASLKIAAYESIWANAKVIV